MKNSISCLLILFVFIILGVHCQNACESLSSDFVTYSELRDCLMAQEYDPKIKEQTLTTLRSIMESYVFVDISRDSPNPNIPMKVDIYKSLEEIENTTYNSDAELQQAFASAFCAYQDAHTRYTKPSIPYCHASFVLPFKIRSTFSDSKQTFLINLADNYVNGTHNLVAVYKNLYGVDLKSLDIQGYNILSINGEDTAIAIGTFANTSVGYTKDYSGRFNLAVDGYGPDFPAMYTCRNQSLQGIPSHQMVNLTLQNPNDKSVIELQINWIGAYKRNVPSFQFNELKSRSLIGKHEISFLKEYAQILEGDTLEVPDASYQILEDSNTAVLQIATFAPKNHTTFINTIQNGLLYFKEKNAEQLIIDLSQNGGGDICLGYALFRSLFPDADPFVGSYDMKASELFNLFATSGANILNSNLTSLQFCGVNPHVVGYFTPCAWYDWYTSENFFDETWFTPGIPYTRGGVSADYTVRITQGCQDAYSLWLPPMGTHFSSDKIILLSDGLCGSTCAVFSRHIQASHLAKTVVSGGVMGGQKPSFTSFPGGEVVDLDYIHKLAEKYDVVNNSLIPPPLPTSASFRFAIRELYGWDGLTLSSLPQEFVYLPADFQVSYTSDYLNHKEVWESVISYFSDCADWETLPCSVNNGTGYYPCENGSFNKEECILESCNAGYENINNGCAPCQLGFYKSSKDLSQCTPCYSIPPNCQYTSYANLSPMCEYQCSQCATATPAPSPTIAPSGVNMPIWLIIVIAVGCCILGLALGGFAGNIITRSYYARKRHSYSQLEQDDNILVDNDSLNLN